MSSISLRILPFVALGLAAILPQAHAKSSKEKAETPLLRPSNPPDANAKGKVTVEHDSDKSRDRLKLEAEKIDTSLTFQAYLENSSGLMEAVGTMPVNGIGEVEIEFDTKEGPALPFGVSQIADLAGRSVEVRSSGLTYLAGTVPSVSGGTGGTGGGGSSSKWIKTKSPMVRPASPPDSDAKGYVEVRRREKDNRNRFKVEAEHISTTMTFSVFLETDVGSGLMNSVGIMTVQSSDEVELELDTGDGAQLPYGVATVDELADRLVEVRGSDGLVYLQGTVPSLSGGGSQQKQKVKSQLSGAVGKAELRLESDPKKPAEEFELRIKKQQKKTSLDVFLFDASQSSFVLVTTVITGGGGNVKYRVTTKKGESLPLGASSLSALAGSAIEVRDGATGAVLFSGNVPKM